MFNFFFVEFTQITITKKINNPQLLIQAIQKFSIQTKQKDSNAFVYSTVENIKAGLENKAPHDVWIIGDSSYCLCRYEHDSDGSLVYKGFQDIYFEYTKAQQKGAGILVGFNNLFKALSTYTDNCCNLLGTDLNPTARVQMMNMRTCR